MTRALFLLAISFVFLVSCGKSNRDPGTSRSVQSKKTSQSRDRRAFLKGQNSYYYYLASQLKSNAGDQTSAAGLLDMALSKDSDSSTLLMRKAYQEARLQNLDQAYRKVKRSLKIEPANVESLLLLGKIHSAKKEYSKAYQVYRKVMSLEPKNIEVYNLMAHDALVAGQKNVATQALQQCLVHLPESVQCLFYLGTIHYESKRYDEAIRYYSRILDFNPEQIDILQRIADIYVQRNDFHRALKIYQQMSASQPEVLEYRLIIGELNYQMGRKEEAISVFQDVLRRFPESDRANYSLGMLYLEKKQDKKASDFLAKIDSDSRFFQSALKKQIEILMANGRYSEAAELIESRSSSKGSPGYYRLRAALLVLSGQNKEALTTLNQALRKHKTDDRLYFQRAMLFERKLKWKDAKEDLKKVIELNPTSFEAYNFLGYAMAENGESLEEALEYVEKANDIRPNQGYILDSIGWIYFQMGKIDEAKSYLLRAIRLQNNEPTILEHLGHLYLKLKNKRKARYYFQKSLKVLRAKPRKSEIEINKIKKIEEILAGF